MARTTVAGYIEILEDTLLAHRIPPLEARLRVREAIKDLPRITRRVLLYGGKREMRTAS